VCSVLDDFSQQEGDYLDRGRRISKDRRLMLQDIWTPRLAQEGVEGESSGACCVAAPPPVRVT
jgi:hypothetical protein